MRVRFRLVKRLRVISFLNIVYDRQLKGIERMITAVNKLNISMKLLLWNAPIELSAKRSGKNSIKRHDGDANLIFYHFHNC